MALEPSVEPIFHEDSYGYRPGRAPLDAVTVCRERCFKKPWVVDLDIQSFFDSVPWDLMLKAVARHSDQKWVVLYVERWLKAPMQRPDGTLVSRVMGTPQGSPISPCLANLFLHYGLDAWMVREFPTVQFERFADDAVIHCVSESQARFVRDAVARRLVAVGLELHPDKTRIVYCKDSRRREDYEEISQGRAGARCRRCRRSVSPTRPPNPACVFLRTGLSTGHAVADRDAVLGIGGLRRGGGPSCSGGRRPG